MAEQTRTVTLRFEVQGDKKVQTAITNIEKAHGQLTKTVTAFNSQGQILNQRITTYTKSLNNATDAAGKHGAVISQLIRFWVGWNVALTAWDRVARPVLDWFRESVKLASDANEAYNRFRVTFGSMSNDMEKWARTSQASITQTTVAVENQLAQLQSLFQGVGFARDRAAEMSKTMVNRAIDISSFRNVQPEDAFEAVRRALLNQPRLLRGMGVPITGEIGKADMMTKTLAQFNKILEKTAIDEGDLIRTQHEWENETRSLESAYRDLRIETGKNITQSVSWGGALEGLVHMADTVTSSVGGMSMAFQGLGLVLITTEIQIARTIAGLDQLRLMAAYAAQPQNAQAAMINWLSPITGTKINMPQVPVSPWFQTASELETNAAQTIKRMIMGSAVGAGNGMQTIPAPPGGGKGNSKLDSLIKKNENFFSAMRGGLRGGFKKNTDAGAAFGWLGNLTGGDFAPIAPFLDLSQGGTATMFSGIPGQGMGWSLGALRGGQPLGMYGIGAAINDFFQFRSEGAIPGSLGIRGLAHNEVSIDPMLERQFMGFMRPGVAFRPTGMQRLNKAFGNQAMWGLGAQAVSGDFGGALGSAADIAGTALGWGPIGTIGKLLFGKGGLFGKGKGKDAGLTPANPIYTRDVAVMELLTQVLNVTKVAQIRGAGVGIDAMTRGVASQFARAGV